MKPHAALDHIRRANARRHIFLQAAHQLLLRAQQRYGDHTAVRGIQAGHDGVDDGLRPRKPLYDHYAAGREDLLEAIAAMAAP